MPTQINGLPAHVLLIHVIVVLVPLGALLTVLSAAWPSARRRIGVVGPITCALVVVFTPITTNAGEWLRHKLENGGGNPAIDKHARLGETFLWYAVALFVVSVGVWLWGRRTPAAPVGSRVATAVVVLVAVAVSILVVWQVYRVGDSGAHAAWDYVHDLH